MGSRGLVVLAFLLGYVYFLSWYFQELRYITRPLGMGWLDILVAIGGFLLILEKGR